MIKKGSQGSRTLISQIKSLILVDKQCILINYFGQLTREFVIILRKKKYQINKNTKKIKKIALQGGRTLDIQLKRLTLQPTELGRLI
ncbi:hypothetical protein pb186bvf_004943 [Paramecium bursaria]